MLTRPSRRASGGADAIEVPVLRFGSAGRRGGDRQPSMSSGPALLISCSKLAVSLLAVCSLHAGVGSPEGLRDERNQTDRPGSITVFEGARLIVGDGSEAIENSAFIVENNRFIRIGRRRQTLAPRGAPRGRPTGETLMHRLDDTYV